MAVYNLPPIEDKTLPEPKTVGEWRPIDLDALAGSLALGEAEARPSELKSIPDAWAQIQLTNDALFMLRHDAKKAVVSQWRGLLALFALQPLYHAEYDLRLSTLAFNAKNRSISTLRDLLTELLPLQSIADGPTWEYLSLIEFVPGNGNAPIEIGVTSPTTLLAPGRMASAAEHDLPWMRDGLGDPLDHDLAPAAWPILVKYLDGLIAALRGQGSGERRDLRDKLLAHLGQFRDACDEKAQAIVAPKLEAVALGKKWPHDFFKPLGSTWKAEVSEGSDCTVALRTLRAGDPATAVLIDPELAETLRVPAGQIRVWGNYTLQDAQSPATLARIREEASAQGVLVVEPDDLFMPELVQLTDNARVPAHRNGFEASLLPLSPLCLLFAKGPADIAARTNLRGRGGEYHVEFHVTLIGPDGNDRDHAIVRTYKADAVVKMPPPDDLALWPDFTSQGWPWTFLRFQYDPKNDLQIRFGASAELIQRDVGQVTGDEAAMRSAKAKRMSEWGSRSGRTVDRRLVPSRTGEVTDRDGTLMLRSLRSIENDATSLVSEQHETATGIEAIFFARRRSQSEPSVPAGCVLVARREIEPQGRSAEVSIDFGTTNTIAYARVDGEPMFRVAFGNRVVFPVEHALESQIAAEYTAFFPLQSHDTPLPTVARKRDFQNLATDELRRIFEDGDPRVGTSHVVFFMPKLAQSVDSTLLVALVNKGSLQFDLKWGGEARKNVIVQNFISQLMVMIAAELLERGVSVSRITWRFSYPQSFNRETKGHFEGLLHEARTALFGDATANAGPGDTLTLITEGAAAAAYFMRDPEQQMQAQGRLMVMLDIGGGSTDIAVRFDETLVWRGSVRLAGTDFFRRYLVNNFEMLKAIDEQAVRGVLEGGTQPGLDATVRRQQLVDLLVAKPDFAENFASKSRIHAQDPRWTGLRQCGNVALAGILFYVGRVLQNLGVDQDALNETTFAFGGRGSSLFRLLDPRDERRPVLAAICNLALLPSDVDVEDANVSPVFSKGPKEEVARGLLLGDVDFVTAGKPARKKRDALPLGLGITANPMKAGEAVRYEADADIAELLGARNVVQVDMDGMNAFLTGLRRQTGLTVDLGANTPRIIQNKTRLAINETLAKLPPEARLDDGDVQTLEPPFISALRLLIEMMSESVSERDKMLSIRQRA